MTTPVFEASPMGLECIYGSRGDVALGWGEDKAAAANKTPIIADNWGEKKEKKRKKERKKDRQTDRQTRRRKNDKEEERKRKT